jgi:putative ABC transport system permease protein
LPDEGLRDFTVVMRMRSHVGNLEDLVRRMVRSLDSDVSVFRVRTMEEVIGQSVRERKFRGQVLGTFAGVAVLLALLGVAAVMAHAVAARAHEMGVRMALGAEQSDLVRMVLAEGARMTLLGTAAGLLAAWWLSRYIGSLLYRVSATDLWTYAGAAVVLVVGGLLAALLPALRASRVDPAVALRYE